MVLEFGGYGLLVASDPVWVASDPWGCGTSGMMDGGRVDQDGPNRVGHVAWWMEEKVDQDGPK